MQLPKRIPQLDALRGISVLAVILFHMRFRISYIPGVEFGWAGVDMFFVLSGFLITGILIESRNDHHYFRNFYARRALRIWPLYFALVLLSFGTAAMKGRDFPQRWAYLLFVQNIVFNIDAAQMHLVHTWSLAVEEQFYAIWPLVTRFLSRRVLGWTCVFVIILSPIGRYYLLVPGTDLEWFYHNPITHLDAMAFGALSAIFVRTTGMRNWSIRWIGLLMIVLGFACASTQLEYPYDARSSISIYTGLSIAFAGILLVALTSRLKLLEFRPLCFIGKISYGLYLIHMPLVAFTREKSIGTLLLGGGALSVAIASASWYFFESPILRLKRHFGDSNSYASGPRFQIPKQANEVATSD